MKSSARASPAAEEEESDENPKIPPHTLCYRLSSLLLVYRFLLNHSLYWTDNTRTTVSGLVIKAHESKAQSPFIPHVVHRQTFSLIYMGLFSDCPQSLSLRAL